MEAHLLVDVDFLGDAGLLVVDVADPEGERPAVAGGAGPCGGQPQCGIALSTKRT